MASPVRLPRAREIRAWEDPRPARSPNFPERRAPGGDSTHSVVALSLRSELLEVRADGLLALADALQGDAVLLDEAGDPAGAAQLRSASAKAASEAGNLRHRARGARDAAAALAT